MSNLTNKETFIRKLDIYPSAGLLLRVLFDLSVANVGMFMGSIITMMVWMFRWPTVPQAFFWDFFKSTWFENIPLLTIACFFGFVLSGLYGVSKKDGYRRILAVVGRSIVAAFLVHTLLIYAAGFKLSRTMFVSGWLFIALLILASRLSRSYFFKTFRLLPLKTYNPGLEKIVQDLTILTHPCCWVRFVRS